VLRGFKLGRWVTEVGNELGVSERTVRRDIAELQDAGFDIEIDKRDGRVIATLAAERNYSPVSITKRERFTLFAVRRMFDIFKGSPFLEDVRNVLAKLAQRMSDKERAEHATFGDRFVYLPDHGTKSYTGKDDIFNAIQTGIMSRKIVRYRYGDARGRKGDGYLAPFGLVMHRNGFYVIGARLRNVDSDVADAPRGMFALERFAGPSICAPTSSLFRRTFEWRTRSTARSGRTWATEVARTRSPSSSAQPRRSSSRRAPGIRRNRARRSATGASASCSEHRTSRRSCRGSSNGGRMPALWHLTLLLRRSGQSSRKHCDNTGDDRSRCARMARR
jgi:hypothetical protein